MQKKMMKKQWKHLLVGALMLAGALTLVNGKAEAAGVTVQPGQTLSELAKANGTTVEALKYTNNLTSDLIRAGQQLNMPFPYKVTDGDYMGYLAKRYNTTVTDIMQVNHLDRNSLFTGEVITIPVNKNGAAMPPVQAVETSASSLPVAQPTAPTAQTPVEVKPEPVQQPTVPTVSGMPYERTVDVKATAYGPGNIEWQWGGYTKMGTKVREGVIAVDPNVIPLGSKVFITGYDSPLLPAGGFVATAEDTGGAIKGNRVDVYINANHNQLLQFGKQNVKIYVLK